MATRSDDWKIEFEHLLADLPPDTVKLVMDGDVEICPCCHQMSAYSWDEANAYDEFPDGNTPPFWKPERGKIAHISTCSGYEWQCGHCHSNIVEADSPINHPCYTHADD
jgi:hypothetical protein